MSVWEHARVRRGMARQLGLHDGWKVVLPVTAGDRVGLDAGPAGSVAVMFGGDVADGSRCPKEI